MSLQIPAETSPVQQENQAHVNMPQLLVSTRGNKRRARFLQPQEYGQSSGTFLPEYLEIVLSGQFSNAHAAFQADFFPHAVPRAALCTLAGG